MNTVPETESHDDFWNSFSDALVVFSISDGSLVRFNQAFSQILGWTPVEGVSLELAPLFHPDDLSLVKALTPRLTRRETVKHFHARMRHRNGDYKWLSWTLSSSDGLVYGVGRDITRRKQQERQLQMLNDARLQLALDAGEMGAWHWDIKNSTSKWWPGMDRVHGLPEGSNAQSMQLYQQLIHPDDREMVAQVVADALRDKRGHRVEYRVVWPDGSVHWLEGRGQLFFDERGEVELMAGIAMDITRRKRTEQDLQFVANASQELAALVDYPTTMDKIARLCVPGFADWCAVDMLDDAGKLQRIAVAHVNPDKVALAHELHSKYPPDPAEPGGVWEVIRSGKSEMVSEITVDMLEASVTDKDYLQALKDLGLRSYIGVPIKGRDRVYGTITFITAESGRHFEQDDLKLADELARRASVAIENTILYQQMRDADRRKDEFLAMLAHELRNPLAPISAAAALLQQVELDQERLRKTSAVIGRQVGHMTELVDDLLDVSRVTRGLIELDKEELDIQHVINEALEQVSPLIRAHGHELTMRLALQSAMVQGDKKRLVQVLANILNNAAKYTPEGGHLAMRTSVQGNEILIDVIDDGIGMTTETAKHAFELFAQAERSSDRSSGGLGLGLALVKSLVELHGGSVNCSSSGLGRGSTFSIRLPRLVERKQPASRPAGEIVAAATPVAPLKILVVDDNVDAAEMLKLLLEAMGHEVLVEHGPVRALEQSKCSKPQVCLIDIGLPEIDGNEVARRLRAQPENAGVVLVAVTGYGQESDRASTLAAGFDHHLVKPVDTTALTSILAGINKN